uniref:Uncharacterized protein n=2 Tax=Oryza TaxID=4527 RepID=A0A0E0QWQ7_ORYRU
MQMLGHDLWLSEQDGGMRHGPREFDDLYNRKGITDIRYFTNSKMHFAEDFLMPTLNLCITNAYIYNDRATAATSMASSKLMLLLERINSLTTNINPLFG